MKPINITLGVLLLLGCGEDDQGYTPIERNPPASETTGKFPWFDSTFYSAPDKPVAVISYFLPDTVNSAHRIVYYYNQTGDIVQESYFFEENNQYNTLRYWYDNGNVVYKKYKDKPWYTKLIYDAENQLQQRIGLDPRSGVLDTLFVFNYHYYRGGEVVVETNLPEFPYRGTPQKSYSYDSLLYEGGRLVEEYRKYISSGSPFSYLQAKREYIYNGQGQLTDVRLAAGISNVQEGSNLFNPGIVETYRYKGDRLQEMRTYNAYRDYALDNIVQYQYTD